LCHNGNTFATYLRIFNVGYLLPCMTMSSKGSTTADYYPPSAKQMRLAMEKEEEEEEETPLLRKDIATVVEELSGR
jgi:hypothetical protein